MCYTLRAVRNAPARATAIPARPLISPGPGPQLSLDLGGGGDQPRILAGPAPLFPAVARASCPSSR